METTKKPIDTYSLSREISIESDTSSSIESITSGKNNTTIIDISISEEAVKSIRKEENISSVEVIVSFINIHKKSN
ncbi:MAG: hypothetical protein QXD23_03450 [Candidatus Micrarchaeaceae archaeon]